MALFLRTTAVMVKNEKYVSLYVYRMSVWRISHKPTSSCFFQMRFAYNITTWEAKKPAFYHGHLAYIEFSR